MNIKELLSVLNESKESAEKEVLSVLKNTLIDALDKQMDSLIIDVYASYEDDIEYSLALAQAKEEFENVFNILTKQERNGNTIINSLIKTDEDKEDAGYRIITELDLDCDLFSGFEKEVYETTLNWFKNK